MVNKLGFIWHHAQDSQSFGGNAEGDRVIPSSSWATSRKGGARLYFLIHDFSLNRDAIGLKGYYSFSLSIKPMAKCRVSYTYDIVVFLKVS